MAPRRYRMGRRAEARDATRERIIAVAVRLHGEQGIGATSWDDLAAGAGVNRATVYRHFRDLDELIPACARHAFEAIDLPSREEISAQLSALADAHDRLLHVVRESCACYARGAGWLRAAWREADLVPALADVNRRIRAGVGVLLEAALDPRLLDGPTLATLTVLADYPFWQQLTDAGVGHEAAARSIAGLIECVVWREGEAPSA